MRFTIRPGDDTVMDMETTLYPRVDLHEAGVGNATSMFYFERRDTRPASTTGAGPSTIPTGW